MKKIVFSFFLVLVFAAPAFSQMDEGSAADHHGGKTPMIETDDMSGMMGDMNLCMGRVDQLGLSDDQIAKLKAIHREMQKKRVRCDADLKIAKIDLSEIMDVKDFNMDKAAAIVKKTGDLKTAFYLAMLADIKEVRSVLTDTQFKQMRKMMMGMRICGARTEAKMMMPKP